LRHERKKQESLDEKLREVFVSDCSGCSEG